MSPEINNCFLCGRGEISGDSSLKRDCSKGLQGPMAEKHFYEQKQHTTTYLLPYFRKHIPHFDQMKILEVGCAEGGFLDELHRLKIHAVGLELEAGRVGLAKEKNPHLRILVGDITDSRIADIIGETFDVIVLRDVIEHIPDREAAFSNINKLLNKKGYLYITFPPKYSGFAGHQQNGRSLLRRIPYLHLLPGWCLRGLGKLFKEKEPLISSIILNFRHGLTIRAFEKYCLKFRLKPVVKELFLFRPIYKIRFHLSPRKFPNVPVIREFLAFGCEYLLQKEGS